VSDIPPTLGEIHAILARALDEDRLERAAARRLTTAFPDARARDALCEAASESKRRGHGDRVSVSRNIFIPLTNLCRDRCSYCTFAKQPDSPEAKTYTVDEVAEAVRGGVLTGCIEALFCLGDKPEVAYRAHRDWLKARGFRSTVDLLEAGCRLAVEGGMLPHTNAGVLSVEEMQRLRPWNASMGLMLETTSARLRGKGMAHQYAPDKEPALRLRMHEEAGELRIPFTSGILLGIGETADERVDTLLAIRDLSDRFGHIQEAIIQPFHPKPDTRMRAASPLADDEVVAWVALARLVLGSHMNVQAPPNLAPGMLEQLLRAGVSDWGGVSPLTVDFINPEAPWPTLTELRLRTQAARQKLVERLPVYPEFILDKPDFLDARMREAVMRLATDDGWAAHGNRANDPHQQSKGEAA
jgi:FO synthase